MPINIAMPIAHETGGPDYAIYYSGGDCIFLVSNYFNRGGCQGICIEPSPAAPDVLAPFHWDLYAFTDGFITFRNNDVVLRLPRELNNAAVDQYNSGRRFLALEPFGPQLRHVIYAFGADPGAAVDDKIRAILTDAHHPGRDITRVSIPGGGTQALQAYLTANPAGVNNLLHDFRNGNIELFVQAGDALGNFMGFQIEIRFLDSCGSYAPEQRNHRPITRYGRPLNPSYYVYLVRHADNAANVDMRTSFAVPPANQNQTHPLNHLFSQASIAAAANGNPDQELDVTAAHPPKPLHVTIDVQNHAGANMADEGIPIAALGNWHESRNNSDPYNTPAPVEWRNYGTMAGDANFNDFCRFLTQVNPGQNNLLPGGAAFDHQHTPAAGHRTRIQTYWDRYAGIFNAVAEAFEIPCELLVSIACKETAGGFWYNQGNFAASHEMDIIRMEPLDQAPNQITRNGTRQHWLTNYRALAPGNATVPIPWNGASQINAPNALTWGQLRDLVHEYAEDVQVSPGVMQTLVGTAMVDTQWINEIYGNNYIHQITFAHGGVNLVADSPPDDPGDLFEDWFGVAVDDAGNNTNVAANTDETLTKMKRALHNIIAGAAHIKHRYNTVINGANGFNLITGFDLPTVASGYNDGADSVNAANPGDSDAEKWERLFALSFYSAHYPMDAPKLFNAAVAHFNTNPLPNPIPTVRFWRS